MMQRSRSLKLSSHLRLMEIMKIEKLQRIMASFVTAVIGCIPPKEVWEFTNDA